MGLHFVELRREPMSKRIEWATRPPLWVLQKLEAAKLEVRSCPFETMTPERCDPWRR